MATNGKVSGEHHVQALNVLIVGAGLGGLTAAIALGREGHNVTIFEQSRFSNEYGAAINVPPNAHGVLLQLGVDPVKAGAVELKWLTEYDKQGELVRSNDLTSPKNIWQHTWLLAHRIDLHNQLKATAISSDHIGRPAQLRTDSRVVDVDPETATVVLEDGSRITGDVVVGADGIHSKLRIKLTQLKPFPSGKSAYRFLLKKEDVLNNPEVCDVVRKDGDMIIWFGVDRRIVMYPTRNNEILNFVCIHPDQASEAVDDTWNEAGNQGNLLKVFQGFDSRALTLLKMADLASLKVWKLMDMEAIPNWHTGKFCLLGDAAHPFLPHQGQGGAQAIEDGASLGVLLHTTTKPTEVAARLKLYQECRKERAETIQEFTRIAGQDIKPGTVNNSAKVIKFFAFNCGHDEHHHSIQKLREWQYKENPKLCWRMPISFGPSPGHSQDFYGQAREKSRSTFVTVSLKFKTSRTLLQNLLPTKSYSFPTPATIAYASFKQTTLDGVSWLAGGGYSYLGLYIHGVRYTKADGSVLNGTFLLVIFENLTDTILSGREELGYPKLYSKLDVNRSSDSYSLKASWRGTQFAEMELQGLQDSEQSPNDPDDGVFFHKYIPATGKPGVADVEYPVCTPEPSPTSPSRCRTTTNGRVRIRGLDWKSLPTLHHIAARLAEIPIYEVVEGRVLEGEGAPDVSGAYRVE